MDEAKVQPKDVIKTTVFLKSMSDFANMNKTYAEFFGDHKPCRSCVAVNEMPKDARLEIEILAYK